MLKRLTAAEKSGPMANRPAIPVRIAAVSAAVLLLAACSQGGQSGAIGGLFESKPKAEKPVGFSPEERLLAQAAPKFQVGDWFRYDNPAVTWRVVAVRGDEVDWVADSGETQTTGHNPLMPALAWASEGRGSGRRLISDVNGALFPLEVGHRMTFKSTVSTDKPPYAWEFQWVCEISAETQVVGPAGTYNTFEIPCGRQRPDEVTFYYAPSVGNYVRLDAANTKGGGIIRRDLLSFERVAYLQDGTRIISSGGEDHQPGFNQADPGAPPPPAEPYAGVQPLPVQISDAMADLKNGQKSGAEMGTQSAAPMSLSAEHNSGAAGQEMAKMPGASTAAEPAGTAPKQMAAAPAGGAYLVHLASYKNAKNADSGWANLKGRYPNLLSGMSPTVKQADLGAKGVFHRLYAGPVATADDAKKLCAAFKQRGVYCMPSKP
jgi:cell division septation protein DedD